MKITDPEIVEALNSGKLANRPNIGGFKYHDVGLYTPGIHSTLSRPTFYQQLDNKKYPISLSTESVLAEDWYIVGQEPAGEAPKAKTSPSPKKPTKPTTKKAVAKKK